jgi:protein TonB
MDRRRELELEARRKRAISLSASVLFHAALLILLALVEVSRPITVEYIELDWGSSSGAPNAAAVQAQAEAPAEPKAPEKVAPKVTEKKKVNPPPAKSPSEEVIRTPKKPEPEKVQAEKDPSPTQSETATSTGKATETAGAGRTQGYSIEWSGVGSRKLLSGRMPRYPEGTDKEMPVLLQFNVLPDGSVSSIFPLRRSDELLEREAMAALRTWRFDPLPPQFEQVAQAGKITFHFKLEP